MRKDTLLPLLVLTFLIINSPCWAGPEPIPSGCYGAGETRAPSLKGNTGLYYLETTSTLSKKGYSIGSHIVFKNYATDVIDQKWVILPLTFSYGLSDNLEIGMVIPFAHYQDDGLHRKYEGLMDTTIGLKWRIIEEGEWYPSLAIKPYTVLPSGSKKKGPGSTRQGLGGDVVDWGAKVLAGKSVGRFGFHIDVDNFYEADTDDPEFIIGAGADFQARDSLALIVEGYLSDERIGRDQINQMLGGVRYDFQNGWIMDAALGTGIASNGSPDFIALVGMSYTTDFFKKVIPPSRPEALPGRRPVKKKVPEVAPKVIPGPKEIHYITISGDTLWELSTRYYQDPFKWKKIYDRNKESIESESRKGGFGSALFYHDHRPRPFVLIFPGQELIIPLPSTSFDSE